jgi:OFA family oxalate/formate antiporter-like MFS transporter
MMGFGASALLLGNLADAMFKSDMGWRTTYVILGVSIFVVILVSALLLKKPGADIIFPESAALGNKKEKKK